MWAEGWQNYRPHWRQIMSAVGDSRAWGLLEVTRMGRSGGRALGLIGGKLCMREVVAGSPASLEVN
jgi:hypothetical protein